MSIVQVQIADDLAKAVAEVFPAGTFEPALEHWLLGEIERRRAAASRTMDLVELARTIRERSPLTSNEEIRKLRHEGRP